MGVFIRAALCALVFSPAVLSAETIILKSGEELDAVSIKPGRRAMRVVANLSEREISKKDLTAEQVARYFRDGETHYLSLETRKVAGNTEYSYFSNGKLAGRRVYNADNRLVRAEGSVPDGIYREYYPGDKIRKEVGFAGGKQNGAFRLYYKDGALQCETWYLNDLMHGTRRVFDSAGDLISEERYVAGRVFRPDMRQAAAGRRNKT